MTEKERKECIVKITNYCEKQNKCANCALAILNECFFDELDNSVLELCINILKREEEHTKKENKTIDVGLVTKKDIIDCICEMNVNTLTTFKEIDYAEQMEIIQNWKIEKAYIGDVWKNIENNKYFCIIATEKNLTHLIGLENGDLQIVDNDFFKINHKVGHIDMDEILKIMREAIS